MALFFEWGLQRTETTSYMHKNYADLKPLHSAYLSVDFGLIKLSTTSNVVSSISYWLSRYVETFVVSLNWHSNLQILINGL